MSTKQLTASRPTLESPNKLPKKVDNTRLDSASTTKLAASNQAVNRNTKYRLIIKNEIQKSDKPPIRPNSLSVAKNKSAQTLKMQNKINENNETKCTQQSKTDPPNIDNSGSKSRTITNIKQDYLNKNNVCPVLKSKVKFIDNATNISINERNFPQTPLTSINDNKASIIKEESQKQRIKYYKGLKITNKNFFDEDFPSFNTGNNPINPLNIQKLEKMTNIKIDSPKEYGDLLNTLEKNEWVRNGITNIENIKCDNTGKVSIVCENLEQKNKLNEILAELKFNPINTKIKDFKFAIHGVPKIRDPNSIFEELEIRDPHRFGPGKTTYSEKFPIDASKNIITFKCTPNIATEFIKKPYVFIGLKKYSVRNFIDLIQCFTCSKFGHISNKCPVINCPNKYRCPNCAGNHQLKTCKMIFTPCCSNCQSSGIADTGHSSWDVRCPYRRSYIAIRRKKIDNNGRKYSDFSC